MTDERKKEKAHRKPVGTQHLLASSLITLIAMFLLVLVTVRFTDDRTGAVYGVCLFPYLLCYGIFMFGARRRIARFVRLYAENLFYVNAKESSAKALMSCVALCAISGASLAVFAWPLSVLVCGFSKGRLALFAICATMPLIGTESALSGFAEGMGEGRIVCLADWLRAVLVLACGIVFAIPGFAYGKKLDALLFTEDCAAAYTALAVSGAFFVSHLVTMLLQLLLRRSILKRLHPLHETGKPRYLGDEPAFLRVVLPLACAFLAVFLAGYGLLAFCFPDDASGLMRGAFSGHYLPVVSIAGMLLFLPQIGKSYTLAEEESLSEAKGAYYMMMRRLSIIALPVGAFLCALAEVIEGALFLLPRDEASRMLMAGAFYAPFFAFALTATLLCLLTKHYRATILSAILLLSTGSAGIVLFFLLKKNIRQGMPFYAALLLTVSFVIFDITCIGLMLKKARYRSGAFFRMIIRPIGASCTVALLLYLLSGLLVHRIGEIPTLIACVLLGTVLYPVLLALVRGIDTDDLLGLPFGAALERLSLRGKR